MSATDADTSEASPATDAEAWRDLDRSEQDRLLSERLADRDDSEANDPAYVGGSDSASAGGGGAGGRGDADFVEMDSAEQLTTIAAIQNKVETETWTATVLGDVEVEFRCISKSVENGYNGIQQRILDAEDSVAGADVETVSDIDDDAMGELGDLEAAIFAFLADVTTDPALSRDFFAGEGGEDGGDGEVEYPARLVGQLMRRVRERIQTRGERIEKFR